MKKRRGVTRQKYAVSIQSQYQTDIGAESRKGGHILFRPSKIAMPFIKLSENLF
jgi:hypothetical protein